MTALTPEVVTAGDRASELVREKTWKAWATDKRVCSVCIRLGVRFQAIAVAEAMLEQEDLSDAERNDLSSHLASLLAVPTPSHDE